MEFSSDFMRRAADAISSKVQGRQLSSEVLEKCPMTIKCTPKKDAQTTASLAAKSGYLRKRNEQGQWQSRFLCTVPHMFLYYFDSETAEAPRAVIDLEMYHNVTRTNNTLKLATFDEQNMRAFYLQGDDSAELNEWLSHLMRDRYFSICEERVAYRSIQTEMSSFFDSTSAVAAKEKAERDALEKQLDAALQGQAEALAVLQGVLSMAGITEDEMSKLADNVDRIGACVQEKMVEMRQQIEHKFYGADAALEAERAVWAAEGGRLGEALVAAEAAIRAGEMALQKQRNCEQLKAQEATGVLDTLVLNFQMLQSAKTASDQKATMLGEQRRVLVKEVRGLRGRVVEAQGELAALGEMNAQLDRGARALWERACQMLGVESAEGSGLEGVEGVE
ncbi:hypothetical protein B484DRAFT_407815, partial [Ochromonadaceae sp. CCMP2298]